MKMPLSKPQRQKRRLVTWLTTLAIIIPLGLLAHLQYVQLVVRSAVDMRFEGDYSGSVAQLEGIRPYALLPIFKRQILLRLAFNYRHLEDYERLHEVAERLALDFPSSLEGYYGQKFLADVLILVDHDPDRAIGLHQDLLSKVRASPSPEDPFHILRRDLLYDHIQVLVRLNRIDQARIVFETFEVEYPSSPHILAIRESLGLK